MCGDATNREDVEQLLDGIKADLTLTDPPYGVNVVKPEGGGIGGYGLLGRQWKDTPPPSQGEQAVTAIKPRIGETQECSKSGLHQQVPRLGTVSSQKFTQQTKLSDWSECRELPPPRLYMPVIGDDSTDSARLHYEIAKDVSTNQIIFGGNYFTDFLPPHKRWLVWDKQNGQNNNFADGELAWTSFDRPLRIYQWRWSGMIRKGKRDIELKERIHPTQKPVGMLEAIIKDHSKEGETILDCFAGSGSVLIACEVSNRICYAMELSEDYCEKIIERWEALTGEKAVLKTP